MSDEDRRVDLLTIALETYHRTPTPLYEKDYYRKVAADLLDRLEGEPQVTDRGETAVVEHVLGDKDMDPEACEAFRLLIERGYITIE